MTRRRPAPASASGFTLFEVMISLLVLTTAILATVGLLPIGIKAQQLSRSQMFASSTALTLMNNFHTPVDKFEGVSRQAPRFDGVPGTDPTGTGVDPYVGWAGQIRDQLVHASAFQPNLEQQMGWQTGVLPVPMEIARRLDSENDEIQKLLDRGGVLLFADPNFMMGLNQGAAMDKTMQVLPAAELQKLVFGVTSLPQQNALSSLPAESLPWYEVYPFPPAWISMQATGRETRRMAAIGGAGGYATENPPNGNTAMFPRQGGAPIYASWWMSWFRGGWQTGGPTGNGNDPGHVPDAVVGWPGFHRSGVMANGRGTGDWTFGFGPMSWEDGGHGTYEPVRFSKPFRPGQEQAAWNPNLPIDHPNGRDDYLSAVPAAAADFQGNGFAHGRNWRFFQDKVGGRWKAGNGLAWGSDPVYGANAAEWAWVCFQRLAGGDDALLSGPRSSYCSDDPLDTGAGAKYHRSGWLPIRALLTNPDHPVYEGMQHSNPDLSDPLSAAVYDDPANPWRPRQWPGSANIPPHPFGGASNSIDASLNWMHHTGQPQGATPTPTYEMRANYRDRAIDLWQAVMPVDSVPAANRLTKNAAALVSDDEGGTMVDCNKYEYGPAQLDKFKFIRPNDLDPDDMPIHPSQVLALSYLAHAAMMVTGYSPPFGQELIQSNNNPLLDVVKIPWENLNWTYQRSPLAAGVPEVSLWAGPTGSPSVEPYSWSWDSWGLAPPLYAPRDIQILPTSQPVLGQGITKDALVVHENAAPGQNVVKVRNDTPYKYTIYPGDELVFEISYYQWYYKWGKPRFGGSSIWGNDDSSPVWSGRYDADPSWGVYPTPHPYPSLQYQCHTFRVVSVEAGGSTYTYPDSPPEVAGGSVLTLTVDPPLPYYPTQFTDARRKITTTGAYLDSGLNTTVSLHANTVLRRVCSEHDRAFARKVYEMCMQWAAAYGSEMPYDWGAPRPANHQVMLDKPLAMLDLFHDAANGTDGTAIREPQQPMSADGSAGAMGTRRKESFHRWMVPSHYAPDSWFHPAPPVTGRHAPTHLGPGRERTSYFYQMAYNDQLQPPTPANDDKRFWLTKPFAAFHRTRSLAFWSADWKAFEDAEEVPSAPVDLAKHGRYVRRDEVAGAFDVIAPFMEYGHSPLVGHPESMYIWTSAERRQRYIDVVGGESAGYLYQNWIGSLGRPTSDDPPGTPQSSGVDQRVTADVHLGHWGADRNGNSLLDRGPVPRSSRMKAVKVQEFYYYDPVLRLHHGN